MCPLHLNSINLHIEGCSGRLSLPTDLCFFCAFPACSCSPCSWPLLFLFPVFPVLHASLLRVLFSVGFDCSVSNLWLKQWLKAATATRALGSSTPNQFILKEEVIQPTCDRKISWKASLSCTGNTLAHAAKLVYLAMSLQWTSSCYRAAISTAVFRCDRLAITGLHMTGRGQEDMKRGKTKAIGQHVCVGCNCSWCGGPWALPNSLRRPFAWDTLHRFRRTALSWLADCGCLTVPHTAFCTGERA